MPNLSKAPNNDRIPVQKDKSGNLYIEFTQPWVKFFTNLIVNDSEVEPKAYLTSDIPAASSHEGKIIYVSDAASGANFQGSDGTSWVNLG